MPLETIKAEDLKLYFVNPSWGIYGGNSVEIGAINFSPSLNPSYTDSSSWTNNGLQPQIRPNGKKGSISMTVPLTVDNFDFIDGMRNQSGEPANAPALFQSSVVYKGLVFKKMSYSLIEDAMIVANINFDIYDYGHAYSSDSNRFDLTTGDYYNFSGAIDLSATTGVLNVKTSELTLQDIYTNESKNSKKLTNYTVDSIDIDFETDYQVVKKIGESVPRKLIKKTEEINAAISMPLLEEQSQIDYLNTFKGHMDSPNPLSDSTFKLSFLFKDIDGNAVNTTVDLDATVTSISSQVNSFNVPQGSISVKQKIK